MEKFVYLFTAIGIFGILFIVPAQLALATHKMLRAKTGKLYCFIPIVNEYYTDIKYVGRASIMSLTKTFFVIVVGITIPVFLNAATSPIFVVCKWLLLAAFILSYIGKVYTVHRYLSDMNAWSNGTCLIYGILYFVGISAIKSMATIFSGGTADAKGQ